jgi:hypothetical protein
MLQQNLPPLLYTLKTDNRSSKVYIFVQTPTMLHPEDCASDINRRETFKPHMNAVQELLCFPLPPSAGCFGLYAPPIQWIIVLPHQVEGQRSLTTHFVALLGSFTSLLVGLHLAVLRRCNSFTFWLHVQRHLFSYFVSWTVHFR